MTCQELFEAKPSNLMPTPQPLSPSGCPVIRPGRIFIVHDCHPVFVGLLPIMAAWLAQFHMTNLKKDSQVTNAEASLNDHSIFFELILQEWAQTRCDHKGYLEHKSFCTPLCVSCREMSPSCQRHGMSRMIPSPRGWPPNR